MNGDVLWSFRVSRVEESMRTCRDRNVKIRQMQEAGASQADIASTFGISIQAVRLVFGKLKADEEAFRRSGELLEEFRRADDLDKKRKVADVLDALLLMPITDTALRSWWEGYKIEEMSMREFMEWVISEKNHAKPGYLITPLLDVRCVGIKGFWSAVKRLTESDLGQKCNAEWRRRLVRLRKCSRIVGAQRTWSKPCEPPPWLTGPRTTGPAPQMEIGTS